MILIQFLLYPVIGFGLGLGFHYAGRLINKLK